MIGSDPNHTGWLHMKIVVQPVVIAIGVIIVALGSMASSAQAGDLLCSFTVECYDAEPCDEAMFDLRLVPGKSENERTIRTVAERTTGTVMQTDTGTMVWQAVTPSTVQVLSWKLDQAARYTLHLTDGPEVVTYHGICEED